MTAAGWMRKLAVQRRVPMATRIMSARVMASANLQVWHRHSTMLYLRVAQELRIQVCHAR